MKSKICGVTNLEDALCAANSGAWAVGFNFYKKSVRYILPAKARKISSRLPKNIIKVGILIDYSKNDIVDALECVDLIQIYQQYQSLDYDKQRFIFALNASSITDVPNDAILQEYGYILLDAPKNKDGLFGGTGRLANWDLARELSKNYKLILAGGLNNDNVDEAIKYVNPFAVDVASGVEREAGYKDHVMVKEFLKRCGNVY